MLLKQKSLHLSNMKQFYFLLTAIIFSIAAYAQKTGSAQLYAYRQAVLPGTVRVDDNGREFPRKPQYNYYIYLVSPAKVSPLEIWVDGQAYNVNTSNIAATPVEYTNPTTGENQSKILVPKSTKKVWQVHLAAEKIHEMNAQGKNLSDKNQLVIIYKCGNKIYYKTALKFSELEPLAMQ